MASTGLYRPGAAQARSVDRPEKCDETPMARGFGDEEVPYSPGDDDSLKPRIDSTHRRLKPRHIQLIGIGGFVKTNLPILRILGAESYGVI